MHKSHLTCRILLNEFLCNHILISVTDTIDYNLEQVGLYHLQYVCDIWHKDRVLQNHQENMLTWNCTGILSSFNSNTSQQVGLHPLYIFRVKVTA